jgi:hypothetical protein
MSGKSSTGTPRKHPGVRGKRPDNYELRVKEALERSEAREHLTDAEQLERLDRRLGKGVGAVKERARLAMRMRKAS